MLLITPAAQTALIKKLALNSKSTSETIMVSEIGSKSSLEQRFRIKVLGGGCSGFQYKFSIDNNILDEDSILGDGDKFEIIIDQYSLPLITNSTLDHHSSIGGEYFFITNPNAKSKCGCGNSFAI